MIRAFAAGVGFAALALTVAAATPEAPSNVDWPSVGGDAAKSHFSGLTDINAGNVQRLGLAWQADLGTGRVQEATPVVVDGILYTSGNLGRAYAFDAATGKPLWKFEPEVDGQINRSACCDQANRGVAVQDGLVYVGALDGVLYALDAKTGAVRWKVDTITDRTHGYTSTGAPEIAGDLVLIGNAGSEMDVRGYVTAYDRRTGKQAWRFWTIPHDPKLGPQETPELEAAARTWGADSRWDIGGGGSVWDAIHYDARFDTVYIGVGNGGPYLAAERSPGGGDNLYLSSVVALDARTGKMKWHYQETPQDSWDFTATQPMVLTDLTIDGTQRPVILHAPKNGVMYVLDRQTGRPLAANLLVRASWASGVDLKTGRPIATPESSDYSKGPRIVFPASAGARNWHPAAYDAKSNTYFASVVDIGNLMFTAPGPKPRVPRALNAGASLIFTSDLQAALPTLPPPIRAEVEKLREYQWVKDKPFTSELRAIDPLTGKSKWAVPLEGWQDRAGVLATAGGLVFQGALSGKFNAYDAGTGKLLKTIDTGSSILAGASTYKVRGVQYVAIQTGWGGGGWGYVPAYSAAYKYGNANRLLVFKVGGGAVPRPKPLPPLTVVEAAPAQAKGVTPATIGEGQGLFFAHCAICHANQPRSISPDLRRLSPGKHELFDQILLEGLLAPAGMPGWGDVLTPRQVAALHAYLINEQAKLRVNELALQKAGKPLDAPALAIMSNY